MKLKHLLFETPADEAQQKGYTARPFGYWEKDGKIVARTVGDKLVPVNAQDTAPASQNSDMKPTGMSAAQAGKTIGQSTPGKEDFSKQKTDSEKAIEKRDKAQDKQAMEQPQVEPNPAISQWSFGKLVDKSELKRFVERRLDKTGFAFGDGVIGEQTIVVNDDAWEDFLNEYKDSENHELISDENSVNQVKQIWNTMPPEVFEEMVIIKKNWQDSDQFREPAPVRIRRNTLINAVCHHYRPTVKSTAAMERGMAMSDNDAREFLKTFRIGEDVELPPSGFSLNSHFARAWAQPGVPERVGVIMRLYPNKNQEIAALALNKVAPRQDVFNDDVNNFLEHDQIMYHSEHEFIRPSGPRARCVNVHKVIRPLAQDGFNGPGYYVTFVIDLEDQGYSQKVHEAAEKKQRNPVFDQIMNTSFGFWNPTRRESSTKLKDILGIE